MIKLHNLHKIYPPGQSALKNIDLKVDPGQFVFIAGASGAGKSTLLRILFGAEKASKGQVVVGGRNLSSAYQDENIAMLRREVGVVFQDYKLLQRRTVLDNVTFGLEVRGIARQDRRSLGLQMLKSLGLEDKAEAFPRMLSGGEQQRVAIARALIHKPRLLMADEPTGNLDPQMTNTVFDLFLEANAAGVTVLVATHNLAVIEELNMRTLVLDRGKIIGDFDRYRAVN